MAKPPPPIHEQIRAAREKRALSQMQVAAMSGLNQSTYSRLESGVREPARVQLQALANALRVTFTIIVAPE